MTWSDVTGDLDLQYALAQGHAVTAYTGVGLGIHVRHGSGPIINGTFVQDALNEITAGLNGTPGAENGAPPWRLTPPNTPRPPHVKPPPPTEKHTAELPAHPQLAFPL